MSTVSLISRRSLSEAKSPEFVGKQDPWLRIRSIMRFGVLLLTILTVTQLLVAQEQSSAIEITDPTVPSNSILLAQGKVEITFAAKSPDVTKIRVRVVTPVDAATRDILIDSTEQLHSVTVNLFKGVNRITLFGFNGQRPDPATSASIEVTCNGRSCGTSEALLENRKELPTANSTLTTATETLLSNPITTLASDNEVRQSFLKTPAGRIVSESSTSTTSPSPPKTAESSPSAASERGTTFPSCSASTKVKVSGNVHIKSEPADQKNPANSITPFANGVVTVNFGEESLTFHTNKVGQYDLFLCPADEYTISVARGGYSAAEPVHIEAGDGPKRVNLEMVVRPLGEYSRAIVGFEQAGASAAKAAQKYFFDLTLSSPLFGKVDPLFGRPVRAWGSVRLTSVPQQVTSSVGTFAGGFAQQVANVKVNEVTQAIQFLAGGELRLRKWSRDLKFGSFDGSTSNRFTLSFIAGGGMTTPINPRETIEVFKVFTGAPGLPTIPPGKDFIAFVSPDRDRFFRQYYGGLRLQTYYFDYRNPDIPLQRFPASLDITFGQNEAITGGRLRGGVLRLEGYYPLPFSEAKFINVFGTALMRLTRTKITDPLILEPAPAGTIVPAANVLMLTIPQINRDYYRIGVGIDFISLIKKWTESDHH